METLRVLDFSFNYVNEIPKSVVGLKQLVMINAERCMLSTLPQTFTHLSTLQARYPSSRSFLISRTEFVVAKQ